MKREIKFRGKRIDNGEWICGSLISDSKDSFRIVVTDGSATYDWYDVQRKTIGQFVGLLDKNGKEIYEEDILKCNDPNAKSPERLYDICSVEMALEDCAFLLKERDSRQMWRFDEQYDDLEIIGNVHDTPELLK